MTGACDRTCATALGIEKPRPSEKIHGTRGHYSRFRLAISMGVFGLLSGPARRIRSLTLASSKCWFHGRNRNSKPPIRSPRRCAISSSHSPRISIIQTKPLHRLGRVLGKRRVFRKPVTPFCERIFRPNQACTVTSAGRFLPSRSS